MNPAPFPEHLDQILSQSVREATSLESALQREGAALASRDLDELNAAVADKQVRVQALEALTRQQTELLQREGYETNAHGMDRVLRDWDEDGVLRPVWERLVEVMSHCHRLNQVNGGVVETSRRRVDQALHILRGEEARTELYDPHGRAFSASSSRPITKA